MAAWVKSKQRQDENTLIVPKVKPEGLQSPVRYLTHFNIDSMGMPEASPHRSRAVPPPRAKRNDISSDNSSDYGLDFTSEEEELLSDILSEFPISDSPKPTIATATAATATIPSSPPGSISISSPDSFFSAQSALSLLDDDEVVSILRASEALAEQVSGPTIRALPDTACGDIENPALPEQKSNPPLRNIGISGQREVANTNADGGEEGLEHPGQGSDTRSPLERFRSPPRKGLSVTDLVSPAWCELQYWYSLTKHGRTRRTPQMRQGSAVHKTLEEQVHTTVPIDIMTKEDGWALRIWNVIHGLRTLRETGMTRELEVWGKVDGQIVTGIIDQLSYECPDPDLEAALLGQDEPGTRPSSRDSPVSALARDKRLSDLSISQFEEEQSEGYAEDRRYIYITDLKTRGSKSRAIPSASSVGFRPTLIQLQLYYHFLHRLVTSDDVTMQDIASRFGVDIHQRLSDGFIAQIASLDESASFYEPTQSSDNESTTSTIDDSNYNTTDFENQDSMTILLNNNSLEKLWYLMKEQLRLTFLPPILADDSTQTPSSPSKSASEDPHSSTPILSPLLTATYIYSPASSPSESPPEDVEYRYIGSRSFIFDFQSLYPYLADKMGWWRGIRLAKGVHIKEAWKCGVCEFRDKCEWRAAKEKEVRQSNGLRR